MKDTWNNAFAQMEAKAKELNITGIAAIATLLADGSMRMELKTYGKTFDDWGNYYAIACSKIMEMVRTGAPSGTLTPLAGEFSDFVGGIVQGDTYLTFTGATGEQDLEVAQAGLAVFNQ